MREDLAMDRVHRGCNHFEEENFVMETSEPIPVLTKDPNLTEVEFFKRELNLEFVNKPKFNKAGKLIIACTEPKKYENMLYSTSDKKIIFILLGNETYDIPKFRYLNTFRSLARVYLYNPPRENCRAGIMSAIATAFDIPKSIFSFKFYRTWKNAFDFAVRSNKANLSYEWEPFPQGYSKKFVQELRYLNLLKGDGSLFTNIRVDNDIPRHGIGFVGQKGSWYRQELIKEFSKRPEFTFVESAGWDIPSDDQRTAYVRSILGNRTTLHLPGNITNQTHRYMECFLLNRIPVCPPYTFQDHHMTKYWTEDKKRLTFFSYRLLSSYVLSLPDADYISLVRSERQQLQQWTEKIRQDLAMFYSRNS